MLLPRRTTVTTSPTTPASKSNVANEKLQAKFLTSAQQKNYPVGMPAWWPRLKLLHPLTDKITCNQNRQLNIQFNKQNCRKGFRKTYITQTPSDALGR